MRRLCVLLVLLACATPAQAAPRAVGPAPDAFALAGDSVLLSRVSGRTLTVEALPGGRVFSYDAPAGSVPSGRLAASPQRAALTLTLRDDTSDIAAAQVFSGPALGPWARCADDRLSENFVLPWQHQVEGERVFTSEIRGSLENNAVVVRDPDPRDLRSRTPPSSPATSWPTPSAARGRTRTRSARGSSSPSGGPASGAASPTSPSRSSTSRCAPTGAWR